jgi:hypothetical protein
LAVDPHVSIPFGRRLTVATAEVSVHDVRRPRDGQVHIADIGFEP